MKSLREVARLLVIWIRHHILSRGYGMNISSSARISYGAKLDKTNPRGIFIDDNSYIASGAIIFSHDYSRGLKTDTRIGKKCFVGANAIVMAGVVVGDEVIVGAGAIVTKDVPSNSIVVGNPARVIRSGIRTTRFGQLIEDRELCASTQDGNIGSL